MADRFSPGKTWRDYTACAPKHADLFFLDVGESPRKSVGTMLKSAWYRADCLEFALTAKPAITRGVWGGKTERELRRSAASNRIPLPAGIPGKTKPAATATARLYACAAHPTTLTRPANMCSAPQGV